jgi:hypothetical protein
MKRLAVALLAFILASATADASPIQTVLTPDSTLYSVDGERHHARLSISRRRGAEKEVVLHVPGTEDDAIDSDARLLFDSNTSTLYVVWHKAALVDDSIVLASLNAKGVWSEPVVLASCASLRRVGLQTMMTRARIGEESAAQATLIHVAWWGVGADMTAEYALVAFEGGRHVSTEVAKLDVLAARNNAEDDAFEDTGAALHPPLAIARAEKGAIDVVYGGDNTTKITRVRLNPERVKGDARLWRPVGRGSGRTDPARLIANSTAPLRAFVSRGRIVLYQPDRKFRFVILENGVWSPERMIELGEHLTSDQLLDALRRTVDEQSATDGVGKQQG